MASAVLPEPDPLFAPGFADGAAERVQVAHLDATGSLLHLFVGEPGTTTAAPLPVRRIAKEALEVGAAAWLIAHNHPGGDPMPSRADVLVTRRLAGLAQLLDIRLLDHLIFAGPQRFSFRAEGLL